MERGAALITMRTHLAVGRRLRDRRQEAAWAHTHFGGHTVTFTVGLDPAVLLSHVCQVKVLTTV